MNTEILVVSPVATYAERDQKVSTSSIINIREMERSISTTLDTWSQAHESNWLVERVLQLVLSVDRLLVVDRRTGLLSERN